VSVKISSLIGLIIQETRKDVFTKWVRSFSLASSIDSRDHFCPWVGGMVGFTRYKFFLQFVTYTAISCSFVIVSVASVRYFFVSLLILKLVPRRLQVSTDFPTTWIILLVLAGFFAVFMIPFSMFITALLISNVRTHIYYTLHNITTNESFDRNVPRSI